MKNLSDGEIKSLEALALSKIKLLCDVSKSMKSFLNDISHETIDNNDNNDSIDIIDRYLNKHQTYFDKIDQLDNSFNLMLDEIEYDKKLNIKELLSVTQNEQVPPGRCWKLYSIIQEQQMMLRDILGLNNEIINQIKNISTKIQKQLKIIKQKKDIQSSYPSYDLNNLHNFKNAGIISDFGKI